MVKTVPRPSRSFISSLKNAGFDVNPKKVDEKDKMFFALEAVKTKNTGSSSNDDGGVDDGKTKKKKMKKSAPVDWPTLKAKVVQETIIERIFLYFQW